MFDRKRIGWLTAGPIAHRGLHDLRQSRPENSLAAFDAAIAAGYAIECDLHPAADGVPVVFHDDDLRRLTGASGSVRDRTSAELRQLRLHRTDQWIPTLDELLARVSGRVPLVIELKHIPGRDEGFASAVVERVKGYDGHAALMSFDPGLVSEVRAAAPGLPRGLIGHGDWRHAGEQFKAMLALRIHFVSYAINDLPTPAPILANRVLGIPLICWTVRNPEQVRKARTWTDQITFEGFLP